MYILLVCCSGDARLLMLLLPSPFLLLLFSNHSSISNWMVHLLCHSQFSSFRFYYFGFNCWFSVAKLFMWLKILNIAICVRLNRFSLHLLTHTRIQSLCICVSVCVCLLLLMCGFVCVTIAYIKFIYSNCLLLAPDQKYCFFFFFSRINLIISANFSRNDRIIFVMKFIHVWRERMCWVLVMLFVCLFVGLLVIAISQFHTLDLKCVGFKLPDSLSSPTSSPEPNAFY